MKLPDGTCGCGAAPLVQYLAVALKEIVDDCREWNQEYSCIAIRNENTVRILEGLGLVELAKVPYEDDKWMACATEAGIAWLAGLDKEKI